MDLFVLDIPDGEQIDFQIALVDEPATDSDWIAFSKEVKQSFIVQSEHKKIVSGYAMIADKEILRIDDERGAYNVVFKKENIEKIWLNFHRNSLSQNTNLDHQTGKLADGVFLCESFIIDSERGIKAPEGFKQEADGSWFISMKVENDEIWEQVLKGDYNGFSIEGRFQEKELKASSILDDFKRIFNNVKMEKTNLKTKISDFFSANPEVKEEVKEVLNKEVFESAVLVDGETKIDAEPAIEVGAAITVTIQDEEAIPAPAGSYEIEDGRVLVVVEDAIGLINEIVLPEVIEDEVTEPIDEEEMAEEATTEQRVKKIIERIETEKTFETVKFLKEENEVLKAQLVDSKAELIELNEAFKSMMTEQFNDLKNFSKEIFEKLADEPTKEPIEKAVNPFKSEAKTNIFLKSKNK